MTQGKEGINEENGSNIIGEFKINKDREASLSLGRKIGERNLNIIVNSKHYKRSPVGSWRCGGGTSLDSFFPKGN